ncbi:hypothetical protein O3G_MSEX001501 [Manduca sexta]|uniref:Exocyst complex component Sec3 C-terminal domain-containing protein n=1 Tax=Manduca sexta TaxID=7130 RepID=A0A921YKM9_MANSE|nr:hypothetical protein O3G_MSEX001501 [Manduca sexta]
MKYEDVTLQREWEGAKEPPDVTVTASEAALGALLEDGDGEQDAERRVRQLGSRVARLDALNVGGMLAAATESGGAGAALAARLDDGLSAAAALGARLRRCDALARAAPDAAHARTDAARADANARALLAELDAIYRWLDPPPLRDLDSLAEPVLTTAEGRARALAAAEALRAALRAEPTMPAPRRRLAAVRERLRRLARAKDQLAAALARHLNNALIHLGNEAAQESRPHRHHTELAPYAPFMRWLKDMDEKAFDALVKVYAGSWARVYEREVRGACEAARAALCRDRTDDLLDHVLSLVESLCNAEQDFCTQFFYLDIDIKSDSSDGEKSEGGERERGDGGRRAGAETRRFMHELFPALEPELVALVGHVERSEPYGAMRALACVGRRVLCAEGERGEQAARKPKCGVFSFVSELEELSGACEAIFATSGRRADLDRWYLSLASAMMHAIQHAEHPRTPRAVLHMENYHRLHGTLSSLRVPALEALRRECRTRYSDALRAYVTQYFGRPLEKLTQFFEGVSEAVASGVREDEVCYRAAFSKHELRRVLALYPAHEVRKSLHRLYRTVEKHLSEEGGLLQVVWRAMQEEFIAQHVALQARVAACYPAAGLALPLTTQDILDAFSDIAREH